MPEQMDTVEPERVEPALERRGISAGVRSGGRERRRAAITRRIPGEHPELRRQPHELIAERGGGPANAVQQDQRRPAAGFPIGKYGLPDPQGGIAHAAANRTSSARAVPASSMKTASASPSLRK